MWKIQRPDGDRRRRPRRVSVDDRQPGRWTVVADLGFGPQVWRVPRLSEFYGIVVYMYFVDHNPPHFHAIYAEHEALIAIDDGSFIRGELPRTAARLVEQWRELHVAELMRNWEHAQEPAAFSAIEPLQ